MFKNKTLIIILPFVVAGCSYLGTNKDTSYDVECDSCKVKIQHIRAKDSINFKLDK